MGPDPMDLTFWPGAVIMMLFAAFSATLVATSGKSTWFHGVTLIAVYAVFAITLYLLPPRNT
jgi:Ca2+:H+ antiporter